MSRDMQIGLLLAVGFLALVGGVLYYRIEHPDELEQYLNGAQAQATTSAGEGPDTSKPDVAPNSLASNTSTNGLPPAPVNSSAPPIETNTPSLTNNGTGNSGTTTGNSVQLTSGAGTNSSPPPAMQPPSANPNASLVDLSVFDKKPAETKPTATAPAPEVKKETPATTTSRSSLPTEPPPSAPTLPSAPPSAAPSIAFDVPLKTTPPEETKKPEEKKPVDVVVKPEGSTNTGVAPPSMTPPSMTPPSMSPPAASSSTLPGASPSNSIPMVDTTIKPTNTNPPTDLNKSQELPQPPGITPPNAGILFDNKPGNNTSPPAPTNTTPLTNNAPAFGSGNNNNATSPPVTDADGFRTYAPKVSLGKPLAESEAALREKRWADNAGSPAPIIPSSSESRSSTGSTSPSNTSPSNLGDRKVVHDTYIPRERAQRGETFSSLSQRLYGDTNYAAALAAYNQEFGFVKMDQPEANEWVAKPNREVLDQRYPNLVRRLTPTSINNTQSNSTLNNNAPASPAANPNLPTYRVGKGEQLFEVAKKTLGDGYRWSEIYALNKDLLRESTELRPDMVLKLPSDAKK